MEVLPFIFLSTILAFVNGSNYAGAAQNTTDNRLLWGTYRPQVYLGIKARVPYSPIFGIMWYKPSKTSSFDYIRHLAEYRDNMSHYGWTKHDLESFGEQHIIDSDLNLNLSTYWIKPDLKSQEDFDYNHWVLRLEATSINQTTSQNDISILWYAATEQDYEVTYENLTMNGTHDSLGDFYLSSIEDSGNAYAEYVDLNNDTHVFNKTYFIVYHVNQNDSYDAKKYFYNEVKNKVGSLPPHLFDPDSLYRAYTPTTGNLILNQRFYALPFTIDLHLTVGTPPKEDQMNMTKTTEHLNEAITNFDEQFEDKFITNKNEENDTVVAAKYALSNMLGTISYSYGELMIQYTNGTLVYSDPCFIFTGTPDKPDHPHGFLWDEGFHNHLISVWNLEYTTQILQSWIDKINEDGWIAREQMIGDESRSGAPPSSWGQIPDSANPPSHILLLGNLIERYQAQNQSIPDILLQFLEDNFEKYILYGEWFMNSQTSDVKENTFRWHGRNKNYCLPSGLDDYPRAPILTDEEAHLDLQVWVIEIVRTLYTISTILNDTARERYYEKKVTAYKTALFDNFWDESRNVYDGFYLDPDSGDKLFNDHLGYTNFFPLLLHVLDPNSTEFSDLFEKLTNETYGMWTEFGIRSLSNKDSYYRKGDNYWTSPLWMNINYLITTALWKYGNNYYGEMTEELKAKVLEAYSSLRQNLISMVVNEYTRTQFIWEVFDDQTGEGFDNYPFTGWTALFVNLVGEIY